jgi:hypothetical protein
MAKHGTMKTEDLDQIVEIPLAQIYVSPTFNARHANHLKIPSSIATEAEEKINNGKGTDIAKLSYTLALEGQDNAVFVRPNPDAKMAAKFPYALIAGFGRVAALGLVAARGIANKDEHPIARQPQWSSQNPTVKAIIKHVTETEAILLNMRENTARNDLEGADLAFGVRQLLAAYALEKGGNERGGARTIALGLGKDERYIGRLIAINKAFDDKTLIHWRAATKSVPILSMEKLATDEKMTPEQRLIEYDKLCGKQEPSGETKPKEKSDPEDNLHAKATENAKFLGRLVESGYAHVADNKWNVRGFMKELTSASACKKVCGEDEQKWADLNDAAKAGFEAGRKEVTAEAIALAAGKGKKSKKTGTTTPEGDDNDSEIAAN